MLGSPVNRRRIGHKFSLRLYIPGLSIKKVLGHISETVHSRVARENFSLESGIEKILKFSSFHLNR